MISLCFVFLALVEFAIVLLVKHRKDWKKKDTDSISDQSKMKSSMEKDRNVVLGQDAGKVCTTRGSRVTSNAASDEPITKKSYYGNTILDEFDALPLTTKIDFTSFFLFNICYILVNLVYWVHCTFI